MQTEQTDTPVVTAEDARSWLEKIVIALLGLVGFLCAISPAFWS